jgi:hypothetical protein
MRTLGVAVLLMAAGLTPAAAELTAREFLDRASSIQSKAFIAGLSVGMDWYQTAAEAQQKGRPLYCTPPKMTITVDQSIKILTDHLARSRPDEADRPLGFVLLKAMMDTFPCP